MLTTQEANFSYSYEVTPIVLNNGIAANYPNNLLPIVQLTEQLSNSFSNTGKYFAEYRVMSGGTLEEWQIAEYPFASLTMAANAVIQNPLRISLIMIAPAQNNGGYPLKNSIFTALKSQIDTHILTGGTFTVLTPAYTYTNCLLTNIIDVSTSSDKQVQFLYQWDFTQPLITQQGAQQVLGNLMNKFQNGLPTPTALTWNSTAPNYGYGAKI